MNLILSEKQAKQNGAADKILAASDGELGNVILANLVGVDAVNLAEIAAKNPNEVRKIISGAQRTALAPRKQKWQRGTAHPHQL